MSSDTKGDFVRECLQDTGVQATIEQFEQAFCNRCLNPECHRSSYHGLSWTRRMKRQLEGLNSPTFLASDDPLFATLSSQDFKSFKQSVAQVSDWSLSPITVEGDAAVLDTSTPAADRRVHHGMLDTRTESPEKLERAVSLLKGDSPAHAPEPAHEPAHEPTPAHEPAREPAPARERAHEPAPASAPVLEGDASKRLGAASTYNTPAPKSGIILPGAPGTHAKSPQPAGNVQVIQPNPWAVTDPADDSKSKRGGSKLRVRLGKSGKADDK